VDQDGAVLERVNRRSRVRTSGGRATGCVGRKGTPASRYPNLLTGETVDVRTREGETFVLVADAFATYPVAWLYGASD